MGSDSFPGQLRQGERVVWTGRPSQGLLFQPYDLFLVPFSLMWGGFAIFWEATVLNSGAPGFFALWGVPFVLAGLFFIFGRFLADAWLRGGISYALTTQRAVIIRNRWGETLDTIELDRASEVRYLAGKNGRGTIRFGRLDTFGAFRGAGAGFGMWMPSLTPVPQFLAIENARTVFDQLQRLRGR